MTVGRPPLSHKERRLASMGFRPTPEIRTKLEVAAAENKRSLSKEIEFRLEMTFRDDWVLERLREIVRVIAT